MASITLGCNFSTEHVQAIERVIGFSTATNCPTRITEVYGSPAGANPFGSVRPSFRETKLTDAEFQKNVRWLRDLGVKTKLTLNSLVPHIKTGNFNRLNILDDSRAQETFAAFVKDYKYLIDGWIIAHPGLVDFMHQFPKSWKLDITISTIMNVHTLGQMQWIKEHWPLVTTVCPAVWKNRDFEWLRAANNIIPLELLANEFCTIGGVECEGLYRQACYLSQSCESKWNPMLTRCIKSRADKPWSWLMARFILPQWLEYYKTNFGIEHFKITGRTHPAEYVEFIGSAYCKEDFDGNLLELWGQLTATLDKENWKENQETEIAKVNIPTRSIESMLHENFPCKSDLCGVLCEKCKNTYTRIKGAIDE